ncbi:MAG: hypothetical protein IJ706_04660 [Clostridia bacterium]|nr:hypothetical protein [Clostridia bacterium]
MIAEMSVMTLVGLTKDKDALLDAMQKTFAVQVKSAKEYAFTEPPKAADHEWIKSFEDRIDKCLKIVDGALSELPKEERKEGVIKDGFGASKDEFFAMEKRKGEIEGYVLGIESANRRRAEIKAETSNLEKTLKSYLPYECLESKLSAYSSTKSTVVYIGIIPSDKANGFFAAADGLELVFVENLGQSAAGTVVGAVAFKSAKEKAEETLSAYGFTKLTLSGDVTVNELERQAEWQIEKLKAEDKELSGKLCGYAQKSRDMKLYADYLAFCGEKAEAESKFGVTKAAFVMEAYVPTEDKEKVRAALSEISPAVFMEFKSVKRDEFAPTLTHNGKVVRNFETVTNLYSAPAYGALDPNAVMSFFFSLFMGVIMADFGYGLLMLVGGFVFASKQREGTSLNRMAKIFAYGGIFAMVVGALFDSWFGYPLLRTIFGAGSPYNNFYDAHLDAINAMTSVMGVNVPAILLWCLGLGTIQIAVGLVLKAVQDFGRGKIIDGICGGLLWAIGLFAFVVWVFGIATKNDGLANVFLYITLGGIGGGILTAGITEKGFGKITKIFTSAYGLVNYVSDILSYARLYGLMLSGAKIAEIFTYTIAVGMLFPMGVFGVIFGVVVIVVGNLFNLAMNLLGAYIHDARLQYVEFYGKFFEGEGEQFRPLGSSAQRIYFK